MWWWLVGALFFGLFRCLLNEIDFALGFPRIGRGYWQTRSVVKFACIITGMVGCFMYMVLCYEQAM